ncbi:MAG: hypothetical protein LBJ41_06805 [Treponema sp.]|jgi:L-alanine-DL-glutamate epimerase-like enolase superfamily enzyme|nr:hypothetical protein [Treponema sp.]
MLIGMNPFWNEVIWEKMFRQSFWAQGNGAIVMAAISAIDIAIWDIKAKVAEAPLYRLLGGKHRDKLRCYASQLQFGWGVDKFLLFKGQSVNSDFYAEAVQKAVAEGYDAIKTNGMRFDKNGNSLPYTASTGSISRDMMKTVEERIKVTQEAVGDGIDIIIENHAMTDASTAIQIGRLVRDYGIMFYVHIIQPDIGNCGGITEAKKICDAEICVSCGQEFLEENTQHTKIFLDKKDVPFQYTY